MKRINEMTAAELAVILIANFSHDPCNLEDAGYIADVLADDYPREDIAAITPDTWSEAWELFSANQ